MEKAGTLSTSKKSLVRVAAIVFWLLLIAQHIFAEKISEPYPSIQFPGFNEIPSVEGKLRYHKLECFRHSSNGEAVRLDMEVVFGTIPKGFHNYVVGIIEKRNTNGLDLFSKTITPGPFAIGIKKSWSEEQRQHNFADMQKWFEKNLADGYPGESFDSISFRKNFYSYDTEMEFITKDSVQMNLANIYLREGIKIEH